MKVSRTSRLNGEYQKEISEILRRLKDRAEVKGIVSVTEADVAPDLKTAKIYVSIYASSEQEKEATFATIKNHAGYIRKELSKVMQMFYIFCKYILQSSRWPFPFAASFLHRANAFHVCVFFFFGLF